ncbi:hypothetical protein VCHA50P415_30063 [Vibrio chagasii]|nr:hypothetical protein VCHA35P150_100065 [Vibrio chagasii]CAH6820095.1 hypothetical protein VCHA36P168_130066 [Vibrio chagasii]CAH6882186.1 hypothetical protein VCHA34P114_30066 [Vibrio chagasii]CAH6882778.1 hypothetical protein VCHA34P131_30064 [Vibrio chagasii]CAH6894026.1 hypothetical protein VCHA34P121_20620 [Vibrio chagasii]
MLVNLYCSHKIYDQSHVVIGFFLPEFGVCIGFTRSRNGINLIN